MDATKVNYYEACDKAIQAMNRWNLDAFGKLKMTKWDKANIIQTVVNVYRRSVKQARKRYYEVGYEAYLIAMALCDVEQKKAQRMADKAITSNWVDRILSETDFVTLYRFDTEAERKAYRLAETLEVSENRDTEIDKALRAWSKQLGQFAINITDYAVIQAYEDAGVEMVEWRTVADERRCHECMSYDGQVFRVDEVPAKPHFGCRCRFIPVFRYQED